VQLNILGLDLSLTSTGYCHNGDAGYISVNASGAKRLQNITSEIGNIIVANKIHAVAIEGYAFAGDTLRLIQSESLVVLSGSRFFLWIFLML